MCIFLELINLCFVVAPGVPCRWRWGLLGEPQSSVMKRERSREAAPTTAAVGSPCWRRGGAFAAAKFWSEILQCGQDASVVQGDEFVAALRSLSECVSQSMHAAQLSRSFSSLVGHCRVAAPAFPTKQPSKGNWAMCKLFTWFPSPCFKPGAAVTVHTRVADGTI